MNREAVCADISELIEAGEEVALVHGGSQETTAMGERLGHPPRFITSPSGHVARFTDKETLEIYAMVVGGKVNKLWVRGLQRAGVNAVGLSGVDGRLLVGRRKEALRMVEGGKRKVLRGDHSGRIEQVNGSLLGHLLEAGYTPVVAPLALTPAGEALNVDADRAAAAVAGALEAPVLVMLTNVPGLLRDPGDEGTLIPYVSRSQVRNQLERCARGRMKKKLVGACEALHAGVRKVIIADGRVARPVHRALAGAGTVIGADHVPVG